MKARIRSGLTRFRKLASAAKPHLLGLLAVAVLLLAALASGTHSAFAVTPVPTATIGLTIPTNTILSASNDWLTTFAPIAAIGIGISIALAVLGYLGKMIVSAFHA